MYRYYCKMRAPTLGTIPTFGLVEIMPFEKRKYIESIDRMAWGWVAYDHPLSPSEVDKYELISAPRERCI